MMLFYFAIYALLSVVMGIFMSGVDGIWGNDLNGIETSLIATLICILIWPLVLLYQAGRVFAALLKIFHL